MCCCFCFVFHLFRGLGLEGQYHTVYRLRQDCARLNCVKCPSQFEEAQLCICVDQCEQSGTVSSCLLVRLCEAEVEEVQAKPHATQGGPCAGHLQLPPIFRCLSTVGLIITH